MVYSHPSYAVELGKYSGTREARLSMPWKLLSPFAKSNR